jgi:putative alpha-1,2-mannosidase
LGFYPVSPGSNEYAIGSPAINNAVIDLGNGKTFTIEVKDQSDKKLYVKKMTLNGKPLNKPFINYEDIIKGSKLVFEMSSTH